MPQPRKQQIKFAQRRLDKSTRDAIAKAITQAQLSHIEIAHLYDVSLSTVVRIKRTLRAPPEQLIVVADVEPWRCPGCGHRITTAACVACRATRSRESIPR
jgi:hypothetical protein